MPTYWSCGTHGTSGVLAHCGEPCTQCAEAAHKLSAAREKVVELAKAAAYADGAEEAAQKLLDLGDAVDELMAIEEDHYV